MSKKAPPIKELTEILKQRFSNQYSIKTFGLGNKNILITKSTLVGAEISVNENEISVDSHSTFEKVSRTLGYITGFILFFLPFMIREGSNSEARYRELELEIGYFLKRKFA
ncbi:hypothetical protein [Ekhidna sp.]